MYIFHEYIHHISDFFFTNIRENKMYFCSTFPTSCRKLQCRNWEMRVFFFTKSPRNNFTNSSCFALGNPNFTPFESLMIIGVRKKKFKAKKHFQKVKSVIWIHTFISSACFRNNKIHGNITNWHVFDLPIYILLKKYIFHNKDLFQILKKTKNIFNTSISNNSLIF